MNRPIAKKLKESLLDWIIWDEIFLHGKVPIFLRSRRIGRREDGLKG